MSMAPTPTPAGVSRFWLVLWTIIRHVPQWAWRVGATGILVTIYLSVLATGFINNSSDLAKKLSKSPGMAFLADYEESRDLKIAHGFALLFCIVALVAWELMLKSAFGDESMFERFAKPEVAKRTLYAVGAAFLTADLWFYYSGISNSSWAKVSFSFAAVLSTVGFVIVNVMVVMISLFLAPKPPKEGA